MMSSSNSTDIAIQFDDAQQQRNAATLGMWVFLATEVLFFGGLVVAYVVYRRQFPTTFAEASQHLNVWVGGVMTSLLLLGSLLVAMADDKIEQEHNPTQLRAAVSRRLLLTAALGIAFLACEFVEYHTLISEGLFPGNGFANQSFTTLPFDGRSAQIYFMLFFCMTGLHALHMLIGVLLVFGMAVAIQRVRQPQQCANVLNGVGLYWHFVDLVWIFLYPMFYLCA